MRADLLLPVAVLIFLTVTASGQRMRYDEEAFKYIQLPLTPLVKDMKTYTLVINYPPSFGVVDKDVAGPKIRSGFKLDAFKRIQEGADLLIEISLKEFHAGSFQLQEITGGLNNNEKTYYHTITYGYPMQVRVVDKVAGKEFYSEWVNEKDYTFKTDKRPDPAVVNADEIYRKLEEGALEGNIAKINASIQSKYDHSVVRVRQKMWAPKTTKKQNYADLDSAQNKALRAFKVIQPDVQNGFDAYRQKVEEPVGIWLAVLKESNLTDKKSRINAEVTSSIRHNLAYAYLWLGEFDKAEEQASISQKEFDETGWPRDFSVEVKNLRARAVANQ